MVTYLAVFAPAGRNWERDFVATLPRYVDDGKFTGIRRILQPSAWYTWLAGCTMISVPVILVSVLTGERHGWVALGAGAAALLGGILWLGRLAGRIEAERDRWTRLWEAHRDNRAAA